MYELKTISTAELQEVQGGIHPMVVWGGAVLYGAAFGVNSRDDYDLGHIFRSVKTSP